MGGVNPTHFRRFIGTNRKPVTKRAQKRPPELSLSQNDPQVEQIRILSTRRPETCYFDQFLIKIVSKTGWQKSTNYANYYFSLNILVEGLLNSRPRVISRPCWICSFRTPPCHQNFFIIIIVVVIDVPSPCIKTLNPRELRSKLTKLDENSCIKILVSSSSTRG